MKHKSKIPAFIRNSGLLISMARRRGIKLGSTSQAYNSTSDDAAITSKTTTGTASQEHSSLSKPKPNKKVVIPLENPDVPSTDLRRKPRGIIRYFKYLPGRFKRFRQIIHPDMTPEEMEERELEKQEKIRDRLGAKEARKYGKTASRHLAILGNREVIGNNTPEAPRKVKMLKWDCWTRDKLFTKIILSMRTEPKYLPAYVRISDLARDPLYSSDLLSSLHHYVKWEADAAGIRLTIFRKGLDGLPVYVAAMDIWKEIPENKPPLTFPVGYGDNSIRIDVDLDDCPHMIVAGATKQGKSNFINQMICFWLWRGLTPQDLQLILFDLKRGMEFCFYEGLPHLYHDDPEEVRIQQETKLLDPDNYKATFIETGIIEEMKDVMPALYRLKHLMDERMLRIKKAGHKDCNAYNRAQHSRQKRIPSMVIVFDEWARIRLTLGTEPESLLAEITSIARAAGMYFVLGTQNPNSAVINGLIKVNFSTKVIFKCSIGGSMSSIGNHSAVGLEEKGRAILQDGGDEWKLQTPRITDGLIQAVVYKAITGKDRVFGDAVDLEEILLYSLDRMDGMLDTSKLYAIYREKKVRYKWLQKALRDAENREFVLSGTAYKVTHKGKNKPRMVVPVEKVVQGGI